MSKQTKRQENNVPRPNPAPTNTHLRVIQERRLHENKIRNWWLGNTNKRLTDDKITATKVKRDNGFTNLVVNTWEPILEKERALPPNWINHREVLVGRTA